jgi:hypothetical protein
MPLPAGVRTRLVMLEQAATPGKWRAWGPYPHAGIYAGTEEAPPCLMMGTLPCSKTTEEDHDIAFVAELRNAAPTLLASDAWVGKAAEAMHEVIGIVMERDRDPAARIEEIYLVMATLREGVPPTEGRNDG